MTELGQPELSPLAREVDAFIKRRDLSEREAARRAGIARATLQALRHQPNGVVTKPDRKDGLVQLGMNRNLVEALAAVSAGYEVAHQTFSADEFALISMFRLMEPQDQDEVQADISRRLDRET